jgi:nitrous oxidase accessory protein
MTRAKLGQLVPPLVAAALIGISFRLPLWSMTMTAPQYRHGLHLTAYGSGMEGDLREINIINHYIGMATIDPRPALEVAMFPIGMALVVALCLLAPLNRWVRRIALTATIAMPVGILVDLQWWLYRFGHSLDPHAPIRMPAFTPLILGVSKLGNFVTTSTISWGVLCMIAAALVLAFGRRLIAGPAARRPATVTPRTIATAAAAVLCVTAATRADAQTTLQQRLDAAPRGATIIVEGGVYPGPIVIRGPMVVVGQGQPVIDGQGKGSVVTVEGDGVVLRGFVIRNSGRQVTEEAAGVSATGNGHVIENNTIEDVYFGIHLSGGNGHLVQGNRIMPGEHHGARPGHGLNVWNTQNSRFIANQISDARDGIYLSFTNQVVVENNVITRCRYGVHSMYSRDAKILNNVLSASLLGAALMLSDRLELRGNRIERHREGSSAYGLLLKDIDNLTAADNIIRSNLVGIYAEGVAAQSSSRAQLAGNTIAGNGVGIALQATAVMTIVGNRFADNLTDVRSLGSRISASTQWSQQGHGNSWSEYSGFDANGDGIGDIPHVIDGVMDALLQRNPGVQAFLYTPAHLAIEAAARMFPLARRDPVAVDRAPVMKTR